ncbi:MAG: ROK family protein [Rhodospirillales bacterium]
MRIGLDLGGTKIEALVLDENGICRFQRRIATPRHDYSATLDALAGLVEAAESELDCRASVGVGIPGAISPASGLVKNANSTWLIGQPLDRDLAARLGRPVRLENDANCFALSEASDGAAAGCKLVFGVILGTGVGGGLVFEGRPWRGSHAIAGEWSHNPLPWPKPDELPGPDCYCGKQGCIETWLSGPGLARDFAEGETDGEAVTAAANDGDPAALAALDRYCDRLARGLAGVINLLDPDAIVLGGGLSKLGRLYREVPRRLQAYVFSDRCETPILPPRHGDASGVRGAAWLWAAR